MYYNVKAVSKSGVKRSYTCWGDPMLHQVDNGELILSVTLCKRKPYTATPEGWELHKETMNVFGNI